MGYLGTQHSKRDGSSYSRLTERTSPSTHVSASLDHLADIRYSSGSTIDITGTSEIPLLDDIEVGPFGRSDRRSEYTEPEMVYSSDGTMDDQHQRDGLWDNAADVRFGVAGR